MFILQQIQGMRHYIKTAGLFSIVLNGSDSEPGVLVSQEVLLHLPGATWKDCGAETY